MTTLSTVLPGNNLLGLHRDSLKISSFSSIWEINLSHKALQDWDVNRAAIGHFKIFTDQSKLKIPYSGGVQQFDQTLR